VETEQGRISGWWRQAVGAAFAARWCRTAPYETQLCVMCDACANVMCVVARTPVWMNPGLDYCDTMCVIMCS
jgi:hypothetical protein